MDTTWALWAAATLIAVSMLAVAMNRRRFTLTQSLRGHVRNTIGTLGETERGGAENAADRMTSGNDGTAG